MNLVVILKKQAREKHARITRPSNQWPYIWSKKYCLANRGTFN